MQQTTLATSQLGQTGLEITGVGFGAWAIGGGDWEFGWGAQDDAESVAAIERALELGVNWIDTDERLTEPALSRHLATVERLVAVAERHDTTAGAVAIAWTLTNPAVDGAIVGFRRPEQVDPLVSAAHLELTPDDLAEIVAAR